MTIERWEDIAAEDGFFRTGACGTFASNKKCLVYRREEIGEAKEHGMDIAKEEVVEKVIGQAKPFCFVEYGEFFNKVIKKTYKIREKDIYNRYPPVLVWTGEKVHVVDFAFDLDWDEETPWDNPLCESVTRPTLHGEVKPGPFVVNLYYVKQFSPVDGVIGYSGGTLSWETVFEKKTWKVICMPMANSNEEVAKLIEKVKGRMLWTESKS